jgi:hypothetical protein
MKELGLYRTSKGGYVPYNTDGNGRDRYIAINSGGFISNNNTVSPDNIRRTGTNLYTKVSYKSVSPYVKSPNFHYHSDGRGRDSYIYSNGGGLIYDSKPLNSYKLTDFLRGSEEVNKNERVWLSKNENKYQKYLRSMERNVVNRLYEKDKDKFIKKKKNENEDEVPKIEEEVKLPKLPSIEQKEKSEPNLYSSLNKNSNNLLLKNKTNNNINDERLFEMLAKINNFDSTRKFKQSNKPFNQAYLHIRNANNNYA